MSEHTSNGQSSELGRVPPTKTTEDEERLTVEEAGSRSHTEQVHGPSQNGDGSHNGGTRADARGTGQDSRGHPNTNGSIMTVRDRHDQVIGTTANVDLGSPKRRLKVELTPEIHRALGVDDRSIEVPADWVAAVRRDAIRLSLAVHDPELLALSRPLEA